MCSEYSLFDKQLEEISEAFGLDATSVTVKAYKVVERGVLLEDGTQVLLHGVKWDRRKCQRVFDEVKVRPKRN